MPSWLRESLFTDLGHGNKTKGFYFAKGGLKLRANLIGVNYGGGVLLYDEGKRKGRGLKNGEI
ncbi:hypothetical protein D1B31_13590 [Neobacillus notoginsengisoli]|uniref:Uncharacterized protein n=1 Tax=Neobacillus notoginsengisoli TaxID=1578198 RepID=A0A417YSN7_9BACI|nr:hypothetical protein D1B31_13590 [Neobacillus notoginsengisoli]